MTLQQDEVLRNEDNFDKWFTELQNIALAGYEFSAFSVESFDKESMREYWEDGLSPSEALIEDIKNI